MTARRTNFFERQESARRNSKYLIFYFAVSVVIIVLTVYAAVRVTFFGQDLIVRTGLPKLGNGGYGFWIPEVFFWSSGICCLLIAVCSVYKSLQLLGGGKSVAIALGGSLVHSATTDYKKKRLLNLVEEMAIASGLPVPPVYLMEEEEGINAFAAGHTTRDAVVGVSAGAIKYLSREELQGVVAHEFSHILNGDMRLNIRLIALLHGILALALAGSMLLRSQRYSGRRYRSRNRKGNDGSLLVFGLFLYLIGYVGVFFGNLIKAAVSREREYLADSSAVQFTRNPDGIAGALKKIGGLAQGSTIERPNANEASHMFFSGIRSNRVNLFATHPPLAERIQAVDPSFDGRFPRVTAESGEEEAVSSVNREKSAGLGSVLGADGIVSSIGSPLWGHLLLSASFLDSIPKELGLSAREPYGACSTVFALLLERENLQVQKRQIDYLRANVNHGVLLETAKLFKVLGEIKDDPIAAKGRLPLLELALPALKSLSPQQYVEFRKVITGLVRADEECSLFEYVLQVVVIRNLDPEFKMKKGSKVRFRTVADVESELGIVLSVVSAASEEGDSKSAFEFGAQKLDGVTLVFQERGVCLKSLDAALAKLGEASPRVKEKLIEACAASVNHDNKLGVEELELLRAISESLDCPIPPVKVY